MSDRGPDPGGRTTRWYRTAAGARLPVLGMGAWRVGNRPERRAGELRALAVGLDLGLTLIDTAEMYGDGASEKLVGEAIRGRREEVFLVTKIVPENASKDGTPLAAERSLRRLGVDRIDLYLLHWPGTWPLDETFEAFERLVEQGKIRWWGVSNFDLDLMTRAAGSTGGARICCNQVLYNLERRGIEWSLLSYCAERGVAVMGYTPLASGALARSAALGSVARRHAATPAQVALAWALRHAGVVAIPKASTEAHVRENAGALSVELDDEDLAALDQAFPPPRGKGPLATL